MDMDEHSLAGPNSEISLRAASRFGTLQPKLVLGRDPLMPFCKACGQEIGTATFCPKCGANQSVRGPPRAAAAPAASPTEGLQENVAGLLCYAPVVGWIIALVLFLIDKRRFVKFHAVQALGVIVALIVVYIALGIFMGMLHVMHIFFLGPLAVSIALAGKFSAVDLPDVQGLSERKIQIACHRGLRRGHRGQIIWLVAITLHQAGLPSLAVSFGLASLLPPIAERRF